MRKRSGMSMGLALAIVALFPALAGAATVTGFRPDCGTAGDRIVIEGTFGATPAVTIGGTAAAVLRANATHILARVGAGTPVGPGAAVTVTDAGGSATAPATYTVLANGSPVVLGQSSPTATAGQLVFLYGLRLSGAQVEIGGVLATQVRASRNVVAFRVPLTVPHGTQTVLLTNGPGLAACDVTLDIVALGAPTLASLDPAGQAPGERLLATGSNLGPFGWHRVEWSGGPAPLVVPGFSDGYGRVRTFVPFAAVPQTAYQVRVLTPAGPSNALAYTPGAPAAPVILTLRPDQGPIGTRFAVNGTGLLRMGAPPSLTLGGLPSPIFGMFRDPSGIDHLLSRVRPVIPVGLQPVQVTVGGQASNVVDFDVTP